MHCVSIVIGKEVFKYYNFHYYFELCINKSFFYLILKLFIYTVFIYLLTNALKISA